MTRHTLKALALLATFSLFTGCAPSRVDNDPPTSPEGPPEFTEIVFRGRYYMSKECRQFNKGEYALGLFTACEVLEVLKGEIKLKHLTNPILPETVEEGKTYTFRWAVSGFVRRSCRPQPDLPFGCGTPAVAGRGRCITAPRTPGC